MLDQKAINSFRQAYQKEYGIMLDSGKATELANRLYTFMDAIYREKKELYKNIPVQFSFNSIK